MPRAPKATSRLDTRNRIDDEKRRYGAYDKRVPGGIAKMHQVAIMTDAEVHILVIPENPRRVPIAYSSSGNIDDALRRIREQEHTEAGICRYDARSFAPIADTTKRRIDDKLTAKGERIGRPPTELPTFDFNINIDSDFNLTEPVQVRGSARGNEMWPSLASRSK